MMSSSRKSSKAQQASDVGVSKWHMLPTELMGEICRLMVKDIASMKSVCKDWCISTPEMVLVNSPMWFSVTKERILFASPAKECIFSIRHNHSLPEIRYSTAVDHLVTLVGGKASIWVLNLATGSLESLPELPNDVEPIRQAMSWFVTGDLYTTFAISGYAEEVTISQYWKLTGWTTKRYNCQHPFFPAANSAPVLKENFIYCLDACSSIGTFDLDTEVWRVLHPSISWPLYVYQTCHLMSASGSIYAMIINKNHQHPPIMLRLNMERKTWEQVRALEGRTVFTGGPTSVVAEDINSMADRIYLPSVLGPSFDHYEAKICCFRKTDPYIC